MEFHEHGAPHSQKHDNVLEGTPGRDVRMDRVLLTQNDVAHIVIKVSLLCWAAWECHHGREFQ